MLPMRRRSVGIIEIEFCGDAVIQSPLQLAGSRHRIETELNRAIGRSGDGQKKCTAFGTAGSDQQNLGTSHVD